ncbi:MAG: hypothetical protein JWN02_855, partial [Acidobacteria bacterium]|nr:hypothetical protein [Acidobacteriota bacterium]
GHSRASLAGPSAVRGFVDDCGGHAPRGDDSVGVVAGELGGPPLFLRRLYPCLLRLVRPLADGAGNVRVRRAAAVSADEICSLARGSGCPSRRVWPREASGRAADRLSAAGHGRGRRAGDPLPLFVSAALAPVLCDVGLRRGADLLGGAVGGGRLPHFASAAGDHRRGHDRLRHLGLAAPATRPRRQSVLGADGAAGAASSSRRGGGAGSDRPPDSRTGRFVLLVRLCRPGAVCHRLRPYRCGSAVPSRRRRDQLAALCHRSRRGDARAVSPAQYLEEPAGGARLPGARAAAGAHSAHHRRRHSRGRAVLFGTSRDPSPSP